MRHAVEVAVAAALVFIGYALGVSNLPTCPAFPDVEYSTTENQGRITCNYQVTRIVERRKLKEK